MTVTLDLPSTVEQAYVAQALARGLQPGQLMSEVLIAAQPSLAESSVDTDEWLSRFDAWLASHAANTIVLPDHSMERESIYGDRGR